MSHKFLIKIPDSCINEQKYVLDYIFDEVFEIPFDIEIHDQKHIEINYQIKSIHLNADFFNNANENWLNKKSMPTLPLPIWELQKDNIVSNCVDQSLPILFGQPGFNTSCNSFFIKSDLFGSIFFMLSRYEEIIISTKDSHDRVSANSSIAHKADFLHRPIVNEYIEVLWFFLKKQWPNLKRKQRMFTKYISCDVDHIIDPASFSLKKTIKRFFARVFRDRLFAQAFLDVLNYFSIKFGIYRYDSCLQGIKKIIELNSKVGNEVTFNFIPLETHKDFDRNILFNTDKGREIIELIVTSGHKIGFHPGYDTFDNLNSFEESFLTFTSNLKLLNISTNYIGGRQHYLRYDISRTPLIWNKMKLKYDSSLAYAEKAGFRCGICYEFPMYDLINRKTLSLIQRPLTIMEGTIIDYEGLGLSQEAVSRFNYFKNLCKQFNGDFVLLWHNSSLVRNEEVIIYRELIED